MGNLGTGWIRTRGMVLDAETRRRGGAESAEVLGLRGAAFGEQGGRSPSCARIDRLKPAPPKARRLRQVVEHHVDHHSGDGDVEPDGEGPAGDLAVLVIA